MTSIFYIIGFCLGVYGGWHLHKSYLESVIKKLERKAQDERENNTFRPSILDDKIDVTIKKTDDIFYLYAKSDGTFLAQGKNSEEIQKKLEDRFPGKSFYGDPSNVKEVNYK